MNELELIDKQFLPYIAGLISWIILLVFKKGGKLKRFDGYLWSPFVVSFSVVCLGWIMLQYSVFDKSVNLFVAMFMHPKIFIVSVLFFSQLLWVSLIFQILSIKYSKKEFLIVAKIFVVIAILPSILAITYGFGS